VRATSRKARLRAEYASWYPNISTTAWYPVSTLVRKLTRQLRRGDGDPGSSPPWVAGARLLNDSHFEFRGGVQRDSTWRTRAGDTTVWPALRNQRDLPLPGSAGESKQRP
jgi:hypothetical protein